MTLHLSGLIIGAAKAITFHTLFSIVQNNSPALKEMPDNRLNHLVRKREPYRGPCSSPLAGCCSVVVKLFRSMFGGTPVWKGSRRAYVCTALALRVAPQEINAVCPFQSYTYRDLNK